MKALILNSGLGNRMGDFTRHNHKSMARLGNGEPIFARQLRLLALAGVREVVVTTGPFADQLEAVARRPQFAGLDVSFVANPVFDQTNYIYSMHLARQHLDDDLLLLHGDLVFNAALLSRLLADPRPDLAIVAPHLPQPEKDFKARLNGGMVTAVAVDIFGADCVAFQPMYKLSRRAAGVWLDRIEAFVAAGNTAVYAENALNEVSGVAAIEAFPSARDFVSEVDTLEDLASVSAAVRQFDFAEQPVLDALDDYRGITDLLASAGSSRPLVVGGQAYESSPVQAWLETSGLEVVVFGEYSPNPKQEEVLEGARRFRDSGCDALVSVGGGSAMDVAKCIKILVATGCDTFPAAASPVERYVPHLAIPATAGTGSESTHFAVVYVDGEKHSVAHDAMLPDWALLEPRLLQSLPDYHKKASLLDALAQCVESVWASGATPTSRRWALEGIRLILDNLFEYFRKGAPFSAEVTRRMLRAANLGGRAINLTKTTAPHAMSYGLTARYGIAHGHAAALCLRAVWRLYERWARDGVPGSEVLLEPLEMLTDAFGAATPLEAVRKLDVILEFLRLGAPEIADSADVHALVDTVNAERLGNSPVPLSVADLQRSYEYVFGLRARPYPESNDSNADVRAEAVPAAGATEPEGLAPGSVLREGSAVRFGDLDALQAYELEILEWFDQFCDRHSLQYYLSEGSILGAVRHGGFIPWDDDVDVMMPRPDYRRLVQLAVSGGFPEAFNLDCFETNSKHWVFGAKLQLTRPTEFSLPKVAHLAQFDGPYIDIFPVDAVERPTGPRFRVQKLLLRGLRRALFMSAGRSRGLRTNPLVRIPLYLLTRLVSTSRIHAWITWVQTEFNGGASATHWANLCSYYPLDREVFPKAWFGEGRRVPFEGEQIPVPVEAEKMLERIYGFGYHGVPSLRISRARSHAFAVDRAVADRLRSARVQASETGAVATRPPAMYSSAIGGKASRSMPSGRTAR